MDKKKEWVNLGLCMDCGSVKERPISRCDKCQKKSGDQSKKSRKKTKELWIASGLCSNCGGERDAEFKWCRLCRSNHSDYSRKRIGLRRQKGVCNTCGGKTEGKKSCEQCRVKYRKYGISDRKRKLDAGVCTNCGSERDSDLKLCFRCREQSKLRRREHVIECRRLGVCLRCKSPSVTKGKRSQCLDCWIRSICQLNTGSEKQWEQLKAKWIEQCGRCVYTNVELIPGKTASVDHKIPVTRGGGNEIENLQWVQFKVNTMKYNYTHEEFVEVCRYVAEKFSTPNS